jgi:hypothetical protein
MQLVVILRVFVVLCTCGTRGTGFVVLYYVQWYLRKWVFRYSVLVYCCNGCIVVFTLDAGLLARSQFAEGTATGHLDIGFLRFHVSFKQMLRWFPCFQVDITCSSCSPPDVNYRNKMTPRFLYTC